MARVEAALAAEPALRAQARAAASASMRALERGVRSDPGRTAAAAGPDRPAARPCWRRRRRSPRRARSAGRLAAGVAGLIVGFAAGQFGPACAAPSEPVAAAAIQAQLPEVLESQVSGTTVAFNDPVQGVSGTVKPLSTFLNADGSYCRAFEAHASDGDGSLTSRGVACRDAEGNWLTRVQVNAV